MLVLEEVSLAYKDGSDKSEICNEVSISFEPGQITGILGPNGCGKSTLVKAIIGLVTPISGKIQFGGIESNVGYVPQDFRSSFFTWTSLRNNIILTLPKSLMQWHKSRRLIDDLKSDFGLEINLRLKPQDCSGGMLQQAAIIRAFALNPNIIVADEPFSALDVKVSSKIRKSFRSKIISQNIVGIVISHNLDDLLSTCDKVILIPNKPYASQERPGYFTIVLLRNEHLLAYNSSKDSSSLEIIAKNLFTNGNR